MLSLSHQSHKGTFERLIRSREGVLMRVYFEVYEYEGGLKGRIIKVEPVVALKGNSRSTSFYLSAPKSAKELFFAKIVSPYSELLTPNSDLRFFTSQPTRAPSFK